MTCRQAPRPSPRPEVLLCQLDIPEALQVTLASGPAPLVILWPGFPL